MKNNTFKSLNDLSKLVANKVDAIHNGQYGLKDVESALLNLNELQERLIVLKFKAIEQLAVQVEKPILNSAEPNEIREENIKEEAPSEIQMTIMDGINEAEKESKIRQEKTKISRKEKKTRSV